MMINPDGLAVVVLLTALLGGWVGFGVGVVYAVKRFRRDGEL